MNPPCCQFAMIQNQIERFPNLHDLKKVEECYNPQIEKCFIIIVSFLWGVLNFYYLIAVCSA